MRTPVRHLLPRSLSLPALALALLGALATTAAPPPAAAAPVTRTPSRAIEPFAAYQPQTTCSPSAKPGTVALRSLVMRAYGGTGDYGIIRNCSVGGRSEHKEGRAWDWKVNAANAAQVRQVNDMLAWLLRTDAYGNRAAQARRLGVMYVIWNRRIWNANKNAWSTYTGADAHVNHVHFSLGWAGALKRTSYWTGVVSGTVRAPAAPRPAPVAPKPAAPQPLTTTATLRVSGAAPAGTTSAFLVEAGKAYLLTATGYYRYGGGTQLADAECSVQPTRGEWQRSTEAEQAEGWTGPKGQLDLQVAGESTRWATIDGERCDPQTHTYVTLLEPQATGRLTMKVLDDVYTDNGGGLTVTVKPVERERTWDGTRG